MKFVLLFALLALALADKYAVLVCGSNTFSNYRHHADVCHAYKILTENGVPAANIITMLYNDVANDRSNPYPGKLYNKPGTNPPDVYAACKDHLDYTGNSVTPANFLHVLKQEAGATGGKKVLKSGPNDEVFIFFSDHGATGLVAFPAGGYLYANDLNAAFKYMSEHKMYKQLTFYLEACESGSMFQNLLPNNINIYATSASNPTESSWGCYCNPQDVVNGKHIGSCLGDLYSVAWMEDTDKGVMTETLQEQYVAVKTRTTQSQVMQWGETDWTSEAIGVFMSGNSMRKQPMITEEPADNRMSPRDVKLDYLYNKYLRDNSPAAYAELQGELRHRDQATATFAKIAKKAAGAEGERLFTDKSLPVTNFDCLKAVNDAVEKYCGTYTDFSLQYVRVMKNLCETVPQNQVLAAVMSVCM